MVYFKIFFDFLRYCVGASADIPKSLEGADWHELYAIAKKQALVGVLFHGIQKLPKELAPDEDLLMKWMGMAQRIKQKNMRLFMDSALVEFGMLSVKCEMLNSLQRELKWLGLWKFAGAVMYVLHEVFGLPEEKMIAPMNENEGAFLLDEIMRGGNFGQYDDRLGDKAGEGKVHRYFRMSLRNMRFANRCSERGSGGGRSFIALGLRSILR